MAVSYDTLKSFCGNEYIRPMLKYAVKRKDGWWASDGCRIICVPMEHTQQGDMRFLCDELPEDVRYPNVENIIDVKGFKSKFTIKISNLENALTKLPKVDEYKEVKRDIEFINCPECYDGEIEIEDTVYYRGSTYSVSATCQCPICHGYGKIPDFEGYNPDKDEYDPDEDETYFEKVKIGRKIPDTYGTLVHIKKAGYIKATCVNDLLRVAKEQGVDEIECGGGDYKNCIVFRIHGVIVGFTPIIDNDKKMKSVDLE